VAYLGRGNGRCPPPLVPERKQFLNTKWPILYQKLKKNYGEERSTLQAAQPLPQWKEDTPSPHFPWPKYCGRAPWAPQSLAPRTSHLRPLPHPSQNPKYASGVKSAVYNYLVYIQRQTQLKVTHCSASSSTSAPDLFFA